MRCSRRLIQMLPMIVPDPEHPWWRQRYNALLKSCLSSTCSFFYFIIDIYSVSDSVSYLCPLSSPCVRTLCSRSCYRTLWLAPDVRLWFMNYLMSIMLAIVYPMLPYPSAMVMVPVLHCLTQQFLPEDARHLRLPDHSHLFPR
jgi:hypothetical protein